MRSANALYMESRRTCEAVHTYKRLIIKQNELALYRFHLWPTTCGVGLTLLPLDGRRYGARRTVLVNLSRQKEMSLPIPTAIISKGVPLLTERPAPPSGPAGVQPGVA
jgi:hypothetical protein